MNFPLYYFYYEKQIQTVNYLRQKKACALKSTQAQTGNSLSLPPMSATLFHLI